MKRLLGVVLLALLSNAHASDVIEKIRIKDVQEPVVFVNGYNFDHCWELDRSKEQDQVMKMSSGKCDDLRDIYAKKAAQQAAEKAETDSRREHWADNNLENCIYGNGSFMSDLNCKILRRERDKENEQAKQKEDDHKRQQELIAEQEKLFSQIRAKKEQERKDDDAKFQAKYQADKAAKEAAREKQEAEWDREDRAAQKRQDTKIAEVKARCGSDYKNPSIGMRIERVKECVAPVKMVSQVNRADGVASLYQYGPVWFNVMSGRVIAWGK